MTVIDRAGGQQGTTQLDDRQQRRQTRKGADHLQDDNERETPSIRTQQPRHALSRLGVGI
ncbi:hypothetical protein [Nonomuraea roseola]|uniref:hypothetical protein n=1 Tax=Nonomuraea roseola TaxID=46179 RepID=UPI0031F9C681